MPELTPAQLQEARTRDRIASEVGRITRLLDLQGREMGAPDVTITALRELRDLRRRVLAREI